jgi:CubicO group peptidase (beta-lactamase class C family)
MLIAFRPIASMGVEVMTQYFSFVGLLGIAVSLAGCPSSDIVVCDPVDCISEQHFSNNIVSSLQTSPGVAGYVVYVGGLPPVYAGYAVLSDNPPSLSILPSNLANIESISKMLTTFAVLQSLKNNNISLDSPIYPYLYSDWQSLAGVGIEPAPEIWTGR